jgi:ATP-dependent DNA helicase RecQ
MLFSYQDRLTQEFFIKKIGEDQQNNDYAAVEKLKAHATRKLEAVIRYAQTHSCRRRMILDYFGDDAKVDGCNCDVCQAAHGGAIVSVGGPIVSDETTTVVRQLLSALARLNRKFGVGMIADVLAGTDTERTQKWGLKSLSVFGLLKSYNTKRIIAMLHRLMESGLARQRSVDGEKHITVIELTTAGAAVMKGEVPPPTTLADIIPAHRSPPFRESSRGISGVDEYEPMRKRAAPAADEVQVDPESQARFEKLRAARLSIAREKGLPPYVICHDSVLRTIAISVPGNLAALERIKGMGPHKVASYGQALLDAVRG